MTRRLLGCDIVGKAFGTPSPLVRVKLVCDDAAVRPTNVSYDIHLPNEGLPEWAQMGPPKEVVSGYTQFSIRSPFPPRYGNHNLRVTATVAWDGGQTVVDRNIEWTSNGGPEVVTENGFSIDDIADTYKYRRGGSLPPEKGR